MSIEESRADAPTSSEQELRLVAETIPTLVWRARPEGDIDYVNGRVLDYFGAPPEDILGWGWMEQVHPDDIAFKVSTWLKNLESGNPHDAVCRMRGGDGRYRWFEVRGEPLRASDGTTLNWYGVMINIDDRRRAEEALRERESGLHQIMEAIPAFVWSTDPSGEPTHVNQRLLDYSGMPFEEFKRLGWEKLVHPDDFPETARAFYQAIHAEMPHQWVTRLRRADGEFRCHQFRIEPQRDQQGRIVQWYGVTVDVEDGREAEQRPRFEAQLRAILNVLPAYTWYAPPSGGLTFVSKRQADFLGLPKDHPLRFGIDIGIPWDAHIPFLHPDDQEKGRKYWADSLRTGEGYEHSYRVRDGQGNYRWLLTRTEPLRASDGTLQLWIGATLDVEELKRAEQARGESEAKFRDYAETASDWFWEIGPDYKFTLLTENAFGADPAGRIGTAYWDHALDLENQPEKWRLIRETLAARRPFRDFLYRSVRADGTPIDVKASGKPVFDAEGEFRGYRGTGTDVTAIMRAQEALRESERSARSALDGIVGLVAVMTPAGEVETVNRQCLEYFGRSLEEQKSWQLTDMVHPEDLPQMLENFRRSIASEIPYHFEQRLRRFDGKYRWFETRGGAVRDDSGRILRWYVLLTDIEDRTQALTRLKQMQSDLAHMNRVSLMGELAASLSHEIAQPLAAAHNNARAAVHFLERGAPGLDQAREALAAVVDDADRAARILDRIRDHTKNVPPRKETFNLNEAIQEVIALARSEVTKGGISIQTHFASGLSPVQADRVQLQQVVLNLVLNAIEALSSADAYPRELLISTEQSPTHGAVVAVRDSGPGIDPERLDRIFQAFYTTKSGGVGMGLAICRSIIEAHAGRLWVEANKPRGAVFRFTLPTGRTES